MEHKLVYNISVLRDASFSRKIRLWHENECIAHIYAAFAKNYLNIFLFIPGCHDILIWSKVKYKEQFYTSR